jgi:hypothetical protein
MQRYIKFRCSRASHCGDVRYTRGHRNNSVGMNSVVADIGITIRLASRPRSSPWLVRVTATQSFPTSDS